MGAIFKNIEPYITNVGAGSIFLEIGSDRYEGSTEVLDRLAGQHHTKLVTVDISNEAKTRLSLRLTQTEFVIESGSKWAKNYKGPPIACLYLDNFDYCWNITTQSSDIDIQQQIIEYAHRGIEMNNQNCQIEHMTQMLYLYPYLEDTAVVVFDDTYQINDCWVGKCGPAVIFLLAQGWSVIHTTTDCGIILKKI